MEMSGQLHASAALPPGEEPLVLIGWAPEPLLDAVVKRKIPSPRRESNPSNPNVQPVAQLYTDWAITGQTENNVKTDVFRIDCRDEVWLN
jgi:hypothetical protein